MTVLPDVFNEAPWLLPLAVLVGWLTLAFALAYCALVLLACLLLAWDAAVKLARWGMGQRPMEDLSRATYPTARGAGCLARGCQQCPDATQGGGDGRRRDKHGADPRSTAAAQARPHSSLINRTAAAGDPPQVLGAGGSGSVGKHGFLEEPVPPPYLAPLLVLGAGGAESVGKHGFLEESVPPPVSGASCSGVLRD